MSKNSKTNFKKVDDQKKPIKSARREKLASALKKNIKLRKADKINNR